MIYFVVSEGLISTNRWKIMEDYEDEPDINEQIFHNNVREHIVSVVLLFVVK